MMRRVVITGIGCVTPLGNDIDTMWRNVLDGDCAIAPTTLFDARTFPTQFASEVRQFNHMDYVPEAFRKGHEVVSRNSGFMIGAAMQAWKMAGLPFPYSTENELPEAGRIGVYLGAGEGPADFEPFVAAITQSWDKEKQDINWQHWCELAFSKMDLQREMEQETNMPVSHIARLFQLRGPSIGCLTACAASTQAIGEATELIRNGQVDMMLTGGAHSMINPLGVTGFNRLTALSTRNDDPKTSSRPFDRTRDGFVLAEGAGALVIEEHECAIRRGANILCEIIGYGSTADAFRVTDQHEDGRGGIAAVQMALKDAGVTINDIDYISAHGTGTAENDSIETKVIRSVFGERAYQIPVSSVKSSLGHLIAAAGVTELITCILAIRDQIIPPTINLNTPDPDCDLDYVPNVSRKAMVHTALSNSFGFGGQNNTLIIRKYEDISAS